MELEAHTWWFCRGHDPSRLAEYELRTPPESMSTNNFETFFSSIQTADDVENTKPHPEIYLKSAHNLNVDPQHCLVFEDSPTGVKAAHAAGMRVIYVNPRRIAETSILSNIHSALSSLEQFSWSKF